LFGASTSINDAGQVVGNIIFGSNANGEGGEGWSGEAAVQWLGGRMYGLGGLVVPSTQVEAAGAINNAGQIAGTQLVLGAQATYYRRACLLTPLNGPAIAIGDATVTEGHDGTREATFTVTLSAPSTQTVTVGYATANGTASAGSDYESTSGTLTFAPGETSKTVTVPVVGDRAPEPNETFSVRLSSPSSGALADDFGLGTIADDEPRITISDVTLREGRRNKTTLFTFTVTLSTAYDQPVTMSFQTANGTATTGDNDYVARAGTLTFAPGETTRTITIEVKGDSKPEADESFYLDLFGLSSNGLFTRKRGIGTILNDG
jgi:hypothetical protein